MSEHRALTSDTSERAARENRQTYERRTTRTTAHVMKVHTTAAEDETNTEDTANVTPLDDDAWRDMAGDAITTDEARRRGVHAQCTLATVRNLRRNPGYSVERLAERCYGARYVNDIRNPDWPQLMVPMLGVHEVIKRVNLNDIRAEDMSFFRAGVIIFSQHVVCFHSDERGGFRLYDNDSVERREGRPRLVRADEVIDEMAGGSLNTVIGVITEGTDLSNRLGPAITSLFTRRTRSA